MNILKTLNKNYFSHLLKKENFISLFIVILIFFFDRISKIKIIKHQQENSLIYINDFINFDLVWNIGIGFGLLSSDSNLIYNSITLVICMVIFFLVYLITIQIN